MEVYIFRHGQTDFNVRGIINCNPKNYVSLNKVGKKQILLSKKKLGEINFEVIFVSDFLRTQQSAYLLAKGKNIPIKIDSRLNEINLNLEGRPIKEYFELRKKSKEDFFKFKIRGGESFSELYKRVKSFFEWLQTKKYTKVGIVTHEAVILVAMFYFKAIKKEEIFNTAIENGSYQMFILD